VLEYGEAGQLLPTCAGEELMGRVILLVDDDPDVREIAGEMIESFGFDVLHAEDGRTALKNAAALDFDALLTDIMMPGMNGYELAAEVRKLKPGVPIVCMSGFSGVQDDADRCDRFLRKPFRSMDLETILRAVLPN